MAESLADQSRPTSQIITPYHIYFNAWLILQKLEVWRLFTNFFYFGTLGAHLSSCNSK